VRIACISAGSACEVTLSESPVGGEFPIVLQTGVKVVLSIKSSGGQRWGVASGITVSRSRSSIIVRGLFDWSVMTGR
jgi:hypothetical protein